MTTEKIRHVSTSPNFSKAIFAANELLIQANLITGFPFPARKLVTEMFGIPTCKFSQARHFRELDIRDFGSQSAVIGKRDGKAILFFDETKPKVHRVFSIIHELGHFRLEHFDIGCVDKDTYNRYEVEANFFAAQLLMPEQILRESQHRGLRITIDVLTEKFAVSKAAAEKRIETLAKTDTDWYKRRNGMYDDIILEKFSGFIDSIKPVSILPSYEEDFELQRERDSRDFYGDRNTYSGW